METTNAATMNAARAAWLGYSESGDYEGSPSTNVVTCAWWAWRMVGMLNLIEGA